MTKQTDQDPIKVELQRRAAELVSDMPWQPSAEDLDRGREVLLDELSSPKNLSISEFAKLSGKSPEKIQQDIKAKRYLVLSDDASKLGSLPDFQLKETGQALSESLMRSAPDVDSWTLYCLLTEPDDALGGLSAAEAVESVGVERMVAILISQLGFISNR